jgi:hypothetical protein
MKCNLAKYLLLASFIIGAQTIALPDTAKADDLDDVMILERPVRPMVIQRIDDRPMIIERRAYTKPLIIKKKHHRWFHDDDNVRVRLPFLEIDVDD